jgi:hypothetical protein
VSRRRRVSIPGLRQRRALRRTGADPAAATIRPVEEVEGYLSGGMPSHDSLDAVIVGGGHNAAMAVPAHRS